VRVEGGVCVCGGGVILESRQVDWVSFIMERLTVNISHTYTPATRTLACSRTDRAVVYHTLGACWVELRQHWNHERT
jgi:hypothetical protein